MFLEESPEQQELRAELRRYYADLLTDEVRAGLAEGGEGGDAWRQVVRQIGKDGWLGIGWPTEFGGQGRPATDQFIFFDETRRAGAPFPFVTINTVGPTIMRFGTEEQKSFFLPKILAGELNFAIGYTEPEAGTDLASLRTRAVRDGEEYVVNGAKIFTSGADMADYIWLATRTDPDAPKHKGISIICVPTSAPGFEWSIINTVGGLTTTQTFYDNVRVPVANRVGEENEGWRMITTQLNHERVGLAAWSGLAISLYEDVVAWAATTPSDEGHVVIEQPWVQMDLAKCKAELEAMWLLNWRMAVHVADGELTGAESSSIKVFGTERILEVARLLSGVVGAAGYLTPGSPGALAAGPARGDRPPGAGQHVRRRRERGPARDRGDRRPRHDAGGAVSAAARRGTTNGSAGRFAELRSPTTARSWPSSSGRKRARPPVAGRGQRADDPPLGRGHGRREPRLPLRRGSPGGRLRPADRAAHHAAGLDHARAHGVQRGRGGPGGRHVPGRRAQRPHDGAARRRGAHLGGGDQLRADVRAAAGRRGPPAGALGDRVDLGAEADRARHGPLPHHPPGLRRAVPDADVRRGRAAVATAPASDEQCRRSTTPASRWPPCASASSSSCRPSARRRGRRARIPR